MKLLVVLFFLAIPFTAPAQDLGFSEYRRFLMSGNQNGKKLAVQTTCTNAEGEVTRIGEAGYDLCLNAARQKLAKKKTTGEKSENLSSPANAAVGTTIHIGE
jgi:hypothetical protein